MTTTTYVSPSLTPITEIGYNDYFFLLFNHVWLFATPWTAVRQASLSFIISQSLLKLMSIESVMLSKLLILYVPLLLLSIFPAMESFPVSQLFASGGQSTGISASAPALPMNIQDWFPLGLTSWISLLSKGLSRVFSNTTVWNHQFFRAQPSLWGNSHLSTSSGKTIALNRWSCVGKVISAF